MPLCHHHERYYIAIYTSTVNTTFDGIGHDQHPYEIIRLYTLYRHQNGMESIPVY